LNPAKLGNQTLALKPFTPEETREIVFKTMLDAEIHHTIQLDGSGPADYRSVVAFFARQLLKDLRLVGGYDVLYGKVKTFMAEHLFTPSPVNLEDPVVLRNLSESDAGKILYDSFKTAINALTIQDAGTSRIEDRIRLRETRPFRTEHRPYLTSEKSIFNKIVGETHSGGFELKFASFLKDAGDVTAFDKNYFAIGFKFDYVKANGDLSTYTPDFIVRAADGVIWIVETKGREELDLPQKMARLKQWCADATAAEENGQRYDFVFVDQISFEKHTPKTFAALATAFTDYKN
jgi:type III restriction enzyme